jgi:hypothetical protein
MPSTATTIREMQGALRRYIGRLLPDFVATSRGPMLLPVVWRSRFLATETQATLAKAPASAGH